MPNGKLSKMESWFKELKKQDLETTHKDAYEYILFLRKKIKDLEFRDLMCPICQGCFILPHAGECGHSFCFKCLLTWTKQESFVRCPVCRLHLQQAPIPNVTLRQQVEQHLELLDDEEKDQINERLEQERDLYDNTPDPWQFMVQSKAQRDKEDNVTRCGECGWEVIGGQCANCGEEYFIAEEESDGESLSRLDLMGDAHESDFEENDQHQPDLEGFVDPDDEIIWDENASQTEDSNASEMEEQVTTNATKRRRNAVVDSDGSDTESDRSFKKPLVAVEKPKTDLTVSIWSEASTKSSDDDDGPAKLSEL